MRRIRLCIVALGVAGGWSCGGDDGGAGDGIGSSTGGPATAGSTSGVSASAGPTMTAGDTTAGSDPTSPTTGDPDTSAGSTAADSGSDSTGAPLGDPVFVGVGYGGMRVRSVDDGLTWNDYTQVADDGGDDMDLLRGVAWGNGRFVAVGWRIVTSDDGVDWVEQDNPTGQWFAAVDWGNDMFIAVGGGGRCGRSTDGLAWEECTDATDDAAFTHVRSLLFHDGLFWTADQLGVLRSTADGEVWTVEDAAFGSPNAGVVDGQVVPVEDTIPADFPTARLTGSNGGIQRADPGSDVFAPVYEVPNGNNVFHTYRFSFAVGYP